MGANSDYYMNLIWASHGEQLRADLNRNVLGLTQFDRAVKGNSQSLGVWGQQMRAVATTVRYAIAGGLVYSLIGATGALSTFEQKLGDIEGLAADVNSSGNLVGLGRQMDQLGDFALQTSNKFGIAVNDIEDYMARFYSSFQRPAGVSTQAFGLQARGYTTEIATLVRALGGEVGDPAALSSGIAGFAQGMPGGTKNPQAAARRLANIIATVTQVSPVLTGVDITRDIGRLAAAQTASGMTPEQIFAVYGAASRRGGSGAVIGRGVSQLLASSLMNPKGKSQAAAYRQAGLPTDPNALHQYQYKGMTAGMAVLSRLLDVVGGGAKIGGALGSTLRNETVDDQTALDAASSTKGLNFTLGSKVFARQESFRQFLNLLSIGGTKAIQDFIKSINDGERTNRAKQRADIVLQRSTLQLAQNAQKNLSLQIVRGFDPILHPAARAISAASDFAVRRPSWQIAAGLGGAALAKIAFGGALGRLAGRIPGLGRIFGGRAAALGPAALVGGGAGIFSSTGIQGGAGSRSNPFWVVIDPLSWFMPGAPQGVGGAGGPGGGGKYVPPWLAKFGGKTALRGVGGVAALVTADIVAGEVQRHINRTRQANGSETVIPDGHPLLKAFGTTPDRGSGFNLSQLTRKHANAQQQKIIDAFSARKITADQAERRLRALQQSNAPGGGTGTAFIASISGEAGVDVWLRATPELKAALMDINKKTHVPVKLWPSQAGAGQSGPTRRGKRK